MGMIRPIMSRPWSVSAYRLILLAGIVVGFVVVPGCSKPASDGLIAVRGRVTLDGQPLPRGSVALRADDGANQWDRPTGSIASDGKYVIFTNGREGAAPGRYRVIIFASEATHSPSGAAHPVMPLSLIPARYNDLGRSPLKLEVTTQSKPGAYDLELTRHDS